MYCANHPQVEAAWQCTRCQRLACGDCVKRIGARRTQVGACVACGSLLKEVSARRVLTGVDDFIDLVRRPFTVDGFLTALGCAIPAAIPFLPFRSWISGAAVAAYYFLIVSHVGRSRDGFPGPSDATDDLDELRAAIFRGLACELAAVIPLLLYLYAFDGTLLELVEHPGTAFLLVFLPLLYLPAVILAVVLTQTMFAAFWPVAWIQVISRAPGSYLQLVGLFVASGIAWWVGNLVCVIMLGRIPFLGGLLVGTGSNLLIFVQACLVGGFLRRNAEVLGYA